MESRLAYESPDLVAKQKMKEEEMFIIIARRAGSDAAERSSAGWRITPGCLRVCFLVYFPFCVASAVADGATALC